MASVQFKANLFANGTRWHNRFALLFQVLAFQVEAMQGCFINQQVAVRAAVCDSAASIMQSIDRIRWLADTEEGEVTTEEAEQFPNMANQKELENDIKEEFLTWLWRAQENLCSLMVGVLEGLL